MKQFRGYYLKKWTEKRPRKLLPVANDGRLQLGVATATATGAPSHKPHEVRNRIVLQKLLRGDIVGR